MTGAQQPLPKQLPDDPWPAQITELHRPRARDRARETTGSPTLQRKRARERARDRARAAEPLSARVLARFLDRLGISGAANLIAAHGARAVKDTCLDARIITWSETTNCPQEGKWQHQGHGTKCAGWKLNRRSEHNTTGWNSPGGMLVYLLRQGRQSP